MIILIKIVKKALTEISQSLMNSSQVFNKILLNTFHALETISTQIGIVISNKLSLNQSLHIQSELMEMNYKKSYINNFLDNYLDMSEGSIKISSSLCSSLNLDADSCSSTSLTSQVSSK